MTSETGAPAHRIVEGCFSCQMNTATNLPPRESIWRSTHWRVAHAHNAGLPGWLVMVSLTHVESFADLPEAACAEFGVLRRNLAQAVKAVTGCMKTYTAEFGEAVGFAHLHIHVIPRHADQPPELKGPRVFGYLTEEYPAIPEADMDNLGLQVRHEMHRLGAQR